MELQKREKWIDICKGIAIIFVVMGHVVSSCHNSGMLMESLAFNFIGKLIYSFHMPLFFMISGFLFVKSKNYPIGVAIKKKFLTYGIPYIVFSLLFWCSKIIFAGFVNGKFDIGDLLTILLYPLSFFWFLYALLLISIIQLLLWNKASKPHQKLIILCIGLAIKMVAEIVPTFVGTINIKDLGLVDVARYYIWFVLGQYVLQKVVDWIKFIIVKRWFLLALSMCSLLYGILVWMLEYYCVNNILIDIVFAYVGSVIICCISLAINECHLLEIVGKQTMPIYLFHGIVISVIRIVIVKMHIPFLEGLTPMVLCTVFGMIIPMLMYQTLKRFRVFDFCVYPTKYITVSSNK